MTTKTTIPQKGRAKDEVLLAVTVVVALVALTLMGYLGARLGGAPPVRAMVRMLVGGGAAMALTMLIGHLFGTVTG